MNTAVAEKRTIWTGSIALDEELSMLKEKDLEKLADYAKYLRWSHINDDYDEDDDDGSWADLPLTEDEKAQIEESERDFKNGECLTLDELVEGF